MKSEHVMEVQEVRALPRRVNWVETIAPPNDFRGGKEVDTGIGCGTLRLVPSSHQMYDESELEQLDDFSLRTLTALQMLRYLRFCLRGVATAHQCGMDSAVATDWLRAMEGCHRLALALADVDSSLAKQPDQPELLRRSLAIRILLQKAETEMDREWDAIHDYIFPPAIREAIEGHSEEARRLRGELLRDWDLGDPQALEALWRVTERSGSWKKVHWEDRPRYVRGAVYKKRYGKLAELRAQFGGPDRLGSRDVERPERSRAGPTSGLRENLDEGMADPHPLQDELLAEDQDLEALIATLLSPRSGEERDRQIMQLVSVDGCSPAEACRAVGAPYSAWQAIQKGARRRRLAS